MPKALDLFCAAGGATKGLQLAGFTVHGIDIKPQPRYCGEGFTQADVFHPAFTYEWFRQFDFIWASPPCQAHTTLRHLQTREYPDLIEPTRELLIRSRLPYVMENVPGSPLINPIMLCGSSFGLKVRRHRLFESSLPLGPAPDCRHAEQGQPIDVSGTGARRIGPRLDGGGGNSYKPSGLTEARFAIGAPWMNRYDISQAIPPAYGEFIGKRVLEIIR